MTSLLIAVVATLLAFAGAAYVDHPKAAAICFVTIPILAILLALPLMFATQRFGYLLSQLERWIKQVKEPRSPTLVDAVQ